MTHFNDAQLSVPIGLLGQLERGNVLLFIGEGVNRGMPNERGLPPSATLAEDLGYDCDYQASDPLTLPYVAYFYKRRFGSNALISFLRKRLWDHTLVPLRAHQLIANLPVPVIVTTTYDDMLERAHRQAGKPYVAVVSNQDVPYADRQKRLLIWLLGRLDRPESLVLTEPQQAAFLEDQRSLSDVLRAELAQRTWLILGFDLRQTWFRTFYASVMRRLDSHGRRAYFSGESPGDYITEWCRDHNIEILAPDVTAVLGELSRALAERKQVEFPETEIEEPHPEHPYKGLSAFTAADQRIFFGRERETQRLADLVRAHRLVVLYGASGTGKTSLVQAGLAPLLERGKPPYTVVTARAADAPLKDVLTAATPTLHTPLVIALDQFEELFVQRSPELRRAFIAELEAILKPEARNIPVKVVLSLREEWLAALSEVESVIPGLYDARFRLLPLDREAARAAIEKPVEPFGVRFEPALVDRLLDDLGGGTMMPPQVQLVCETLHNSLPRGQRKITSTRYVELGSAQGILGRFLKDELARVPTNQRPLAQGILEELVSSQGTKIAKTAAELGCALETDVEQLQPILQTLAGRLLRVIVGEDKRLYELAHEYLVAEIQLSAETQARKQAEELIKQEMENWQRRRKKLAGSDTDSARAWLGADKLALIGEVREALRLDIKAWNFLLRSALACNHDVTSWLAQHPVPRQAAGEVVSFLMEADLKEEKALFINIAEELGREDNEQQEWYKPLTLSLSLVGGLSVDKGREDNKLQKWCDKLVRRLKDNLALTDKAVQVGARKILACMGPPPDLSCGNRLLIYRERAPFLRIPQYISQILAFGIAGALGGLLSGVPLIPLGFWLGFMHQREDLTLVGSVVRLMLIFGPSLGLASMLIGLGLGVGIVLGRGRSLFLEVTSSMVGGMAGGALVVIYLYLSYIVNTSTSMLVAVPLFALLCGLVAGLIVYCVRRVKKLIRRGQTAGQIIAGMATGAAIGIVGDVFFHSFPDFILIGTLFGTGTVAGLSLAEHRFELGRG